MRVRNLEADRAATARWRRENPASSLLSQIHGNAKTRKREFTLTLEQLTKMLEPMRCSVTGMTLSWEWDGEGTNPWAPSVDRINCSKGYVEGNVRVVCWAYNIARRDWPDEVVMTWVRRMCCE